MSTEPETPRQIHTAPRMVHNYQTGPNAALLYLARRNPPRLVSLTPTPVLFDTPEHGLALRQRDARRSQRRPGLAAVRHRLVSKFVFCPSL